MTVAAYLGSRLARPDRTERDARGVTAFFAVWTVHHDCDETSFARTQRGWLKNLVSYDMFYHLEHYLFPRVPQRNLPTLAARLDQAAPDFTRRNIY